jgi:hypothetical protein
MAIYLHTTTVAPDPGEPLDVRLNRATIGAPFAVIELDSHHVTLTIHTTAEADQLIRAAVTAKDLLASRTPDPDPEPPSGGCPATWGDPADPMRCAKPSGHEGNHTTAEGIEWAGKDPLTALVHLAEGKHGEFSATSAAAVIPPHQAADDEDPCGLYSPPEDPADPESSWICGAQRGHSGPDHVAYIEDGIEMHWPVTGSEAVLSAVFCNRPAHTPRCCPGGAAAFGKPTSSSVARVARTAGAA